VIVKRQGGSDLVNEWLAQRQERDKDDEIVVENVQESSQKMDETPTLRHGNSLDLYHPLTCQWVRDAKHAGAEHVAMASTAQSTM